MVDEESKHVSFSEQINHFYNLDNKMIEAYITKTDNFSKQESLANILDEEAFLLYSRQQQKEPQYMLNLPFTVFWFEMCKEHNLIDFFDTLLLNIRKFRDTYKLQLVSQIQHEAQQIAKQEQAEKVFFRREMSHFSSDELRDTLNRILQTTLKIMFRLTQYVENDEDYFTLDYYKDMVFDRMFFDVAKLFDIAAIFGQSNPDTVRKIIENVFENDKRFV